MATLREIATQLVVDHADFEAWDGYAEPGYSLREDQIGIVFANWNDKSHYDEDLREFVVDDDTMPRLARIAEWLGFEIEWSDEWCVCECGKAFRVNADSYSWTMHGHIFDGWVECGDCIKEDPTNYIEDIQGSYRNADTILGATLADHGYARVDIQFEHGLYGGQDASPRAIWNTLYESQITGVIFSIDTVGQFDSHFSVWVREDDLEDATEALAHGNTRCELDPAEACKRALQSASEQMRDLQGDGIRYAKCNPDGTADVRLVSPEEFVAGIRD